jgi:hypothetical protein
MGATILALLSSGGIAQGLPQIALRIAEMVELLEMKHVMQGLESMVASQTVLEI